MEIWDAYDEKLNIIAGRSLVRGEPIPDGCYHLVSDVLVRHVDGSYLLMKRDERKNLGGMWEATAGGSALKGEDSYACAMRELYEETGIAAGELTELGRVVHHENKTIYVEYLCITDVDKSGIVLQEGETSDYRWVDAAKLREMSKDELSTKRILVFIRELN